MAGPVRQGDEAIVQEIDVPDIKVADIRGQHRRCHRHFATLGAWASLAAGPAQMLLALISKKPFVVQDFQKWVEDQTRDKSITTNQRRNCEWGSLGCSMTASHVPRHPWVNAKTYNRCYVAFV